MVQPRVLEREFGSILRGEDVDAFPWRATLLGSPPEYLTPCPGTAFVAALDVPHARGSGTVVRPSIEHVSRHRPERRKFLSDPSIGAGSDSLYNRGGWLPVPWPHHLLAVWSRAPSGKPHRWRCLPLNDHSDGHAGLAAPHIVINPPKVIFSGNH